MKNLILSTLLTVTATIYHAVPHQTDSTPVRTATNVKINRYIPEFLGIIAVSRDLESKGFKMNTLVKVSNAGDMNGIWVIRDRMNKRWTNRIDFLVDETMKGGKWTNVKIEIYEHNK
jgi:3D (Asp-Asp-Asp) domain-containing protein